MELVKNNIVQIREPSSATIIDLMHYVYQLEKDDFTKRSDELSIEEKKGKIVAFENMLAESSTKLDSAMAKEITALTTKEITDLSSNNLLKGLSSKKKAAILKLL